MSVKKYTVKILAPNVVNHGTAYNHTDVIELEADNVYSENGAMFFEREGAVVLTVPLGKAIIGFKDKLISWR